MGIPAIMRAAVIYEVGGPEQLKLEARPVPTPEAGETLIRIEAVGLNRSEMFTRLGDSQKVVAFPRTLRIDA